MTASVKKLLQAALGLSVGERADLAARLIDSIDGAIDADAETAWKDEIAERNQEVDSAAVQLIPWPQARQMILQTKDGNHS